MAKINHSNFLDVVDNIWTSAKEKGVMHINSTEKEFDGTTFSIKGKEYINFGTCGYLGLEKHPKLIEGGMEMMKKYGTQLSVSRAYIRSPYMQELEEIISQMFDSKKVIIYTSTSTVHQSIIGTAIKPEDLIILDQQVHYSVQYPCQFAKLQGTQVKMVRHSNYDMLETIIKEEANKYNRIWYMADGVYSMHGDLPNTNRLKELMNKYPKLHLYFDDAHGVGWAGKNGAGKLFSELGVSERIIIISTLAKGFGCVGGVAVFGDNELYRKVDTYGGILCYSHPLSPANVGAAIASAKIHLSSEIYEYQRELKALVDYMNLRLLEKNLTNTSAEETPIYFIGAGSYKVTHNLIKRILNEGIYVNTATFPVVPNDKSGLRFTLTRHNTRNDIDTLADALSYHLPKAIEEENEIIEDVYKVFNIPYLGENKNTKSVSNSDLILKEYTTISDIETDLWDNALAERGNTSHSGMKCMEEIFSNNIEKENNWSFHYPIIKDVNGKLVCTTFFTSTWAKDDVLALENVSRKIEEVRKHDPYYLCSKTLMMGSLFSEGDFLFIDTNHPLWKEALSILLSYVEKIKKQTASTTVIFRDFEEGHPIKNILLKEGYVLLNMPNSNIIKNEGWETNEELLQSIESKRKRKNINQYAIRHSNKFDIEVKTTLSSDESNKYFNLFSNVKDKNLAFNFFTFPKKTVSILSKYKEWEFITLKLKGESEDILSVWSYIGKNKYCPLIMGLDYNYLSSHLIYKQALFQILIRANKLKLETILLGFSADLEKQQYGATSVKKYGFIKVDDTYNLELIESYSNI